MPGALRKARRVQETSGRTENARRLLGELDELRIQGRAPPTAYVTISAGLGDIEPAFDWLETAYRLREGYLFWLAGAPGLDPLRSDLRFADLVRRMGITPRQALGARLSVLTPP